MSESNKGRYLRTNSELPYTNKEINKVASHIQKGNLRAFPKRLASNLSESTPTLDSPSTSRTNKYMTESSSALQDPRERLPSFTMLLTSETSTGQASRVFAHRAHLPCARHYLKHLVEGQQSNCDQALSETRSLWASLFTDFIHTLIYLL